MKLTVTLLLSVLLFDKYLCQPTAKFPTDPDINASINNKILLSVENGNDKIKLMNLNHDVLFIIFEQLDFMDLLSLTEASPDFFPLVTEILRRKNYEVTIRNAHSVDKLNGRSFNEFVVEKRIEITYFDLILTVLKQLGHAIRHLNVEFSYIRNNEAAIISQFINEYASVSLKTLRLSYVKNDTFEHFIIPFEGVEELHFGIDINEFKSDISSLNYLFPRLQRLGLSLFSNVNYDFMDCELPHLKHLNLFIASEAWECKEQIEAFLRKNTQIQSLGIDFLPIDHVKISLKDINRLLPNIENLTLSTFNIGQESVRFERVKHFVLDHNIIAPLAKLTFARLESFQMNYFQGDFNAWNNFVARHNNLSRLCVDSLNMDFRTHLVDILDALPYLSEMVLSKIRRGPVNFETISQIIGNNRNLTKFEFTTDLMAGHEFDDMKERFQNEWHVEFIRIKGCKGLSLQRNI